MFVCFVFFRNEHGLSNPTHFFILKKDFLFFSTHREDELLILPLYFIVNKRFNSF